MINFRTLCMFPLAILKTFLAYLHSVLGISLLDAGQDHFAPHESAGFEGYYCRTQLEDGGTLALIFCWVKGAPTRRNLVCVVYHPVQTSELPAFTYAFYPETLDTEVDEQKRPGIRTSFALRATGIGTVRVAAEQVDYVVSVPDIDLLVRLRLTNHTPWHETRPLDGPMGPLVHLWPLLPINWYVASVASDAMYSITHAGRTRQGVGVAHLEKNWGSSFPNGWIWSQTFNGDRGSFSLAGGETLLGIQAYLIGYRSPRFQWDLTPPCTMAIWGLSPFMCVQHDSCIGRVELVVKTWLRKLVVTIQAPPDSFVGLPAPLREGHRSGFAFESFTAVVNVELWARRLPWEDWTRVETCCSGSTTDDVPRAALEFGGVFSHYVQPSDS